jgi:hypothetical protein
MNEEWDLLSEKFRYQNGVIYLYDIIENFLAEARDKYSNGYDAENSESIIENEKYIRMNNFGEMEVVEEEEASFSRKGLTKLDLNTFRIRNEGFIEQNGAVEGLNRQNIDNKYLAS